MIRLSLNADGDLPSQLTTALRGRSIDLGSDQDDAPHAYTALAACWRKVSGAGSQALAELRRLQAEGVNGRFEPKTLTQDLGALIYAATETFDFYIAAFPKRLEVGRPKTEVRLIRDYQSKVKRLRDPIALMCNRMKHDYREIIGGRIVSEQASLMTFVYRLNTAYGEVQRGDSDVHGKIGFASVERALHEILHGLLRADYNAARLVEALEDNQGPAIGLAGLTRLGLSSVLEGLSQRPLTVASTEPALFDGIAREGGEVVLTRVAARKVPEPTRRMMRLTVDEVAHSADLML